MQPHEINVAGIWELGSGTRLWDSEKGPGIALFGWMLLP